MTKFKFKLKLQGLELEMEGSREDIPLMAQNLGNQLAGLIQPAADMAEDKNKDQSQQQSLPTIDHSLGDAPDSKKQRRRRRATTAPQSANSGAKPIEWTHDAAKYGSPQQTWSTATKAIWTLYVVLQELSLAQLTAPQIADTFNRKFKQAGTVRATNVSRDLGNLKVKNPSLTGEDTTKAVAEWFLTDVGVKSAQDTISQNQAK
jgi:hypothetical protein